MTSSLRKKRQITVQNIPGKTANRRSLLAEFARILAAPALLSATWWLPLPGIAAEPAAVISASSPIAGQSAPPSVPLKWKARTPLVTPPPASATPAANPWATAPTPVQASPVQPAATWETNSGEPKLLAPAGKAAPIGQSVLKSEPTPARPISVDSQVKPAQGQAIPVADSSQPLLALQPPAGAFEIPSGAAPRAVEPRAAEPRAVELPPPSAMPIGIKQLLDEWMRLKAVQDCEAVHKKNDANTLDKLDVDISPARSARADVREIEWRDKDGALLGKGNAVDFDDATQQVTIAIPQADLRMALPIEGLNYSFDEQNSKLTVTMPDGSKQTFDLKDIELDFREERIRVGDDERFSRVLVIRVPQPDKRVQIAKSDLAAGSLAEFQRAWKSSWTKRGSGAPLIGYARPVYYLHGEVELLSIDGKQTIKVPLNELTDEDQLYFRNAWKMPTDDRTWTTRSDKKSYVGKLYDIQKYDAVIQLSNNSLVSIPLHELTNKDLWYTTDGWGIPSECRISGDLVRTVTAGETRNWAPLTFTWTASALCHKPLYFEEVAHERYGHTAGLLLGPAVSAAHFFGTVPILPYKMGMNLPTECQFSLGYYRPGDCAPYLLPPFPISARGALFQAGATLGLVYGLP